MSDNENKDVVPLDKLVRCRRTGRDFDLGQHQKCPYCFGKKKDVATGDYAEFCDFRRGDPVHFGFPEGTSRHEHG